jgi:transcription initiation factor IIF auxiliary subunit
MEAKPILIVRHSIETDFDSLDDAIKMLAENMPDYHVLVVQLEEEESMSFEVLNPSDANDVQIDEIKKMVENFMKPKKYPKEEIVN